MRRTASLIDADHPETTAGSHVRDAAKVLMWGSTEGARRHLDAAMEVLTPRNLIRHGITDDEGHALAKHHMHLVHQHRLAVQDLEDLRARNDTFRQPPDNAPDNAGNTGQIAAAGEPGEVIDLVGKKGYVHGWKYVGVGQAPALRSVGVNVKTKGKHTGFYETDLPLPGMGPGHQTPGFVGTKGSVFGRHLSLKEAMGASEALGTPSKKESVARAGEVEAVFRHQLTKGQRVIYDKLRKRGRSPYGAYIIAAAVKKGTLAAGLASELEDALRILELVGPHGYVHGWIKVGATGVFAPGTLPGSFEHIRAIEDFAERAGISSGDPAHASPTMRNALHNVASAVGGRDMHRARIHLDMARWANVHEAGGKHTRELADLNRQLRRVPPGVTGWEGKIKNPLHESMQHPGSIQSSIRPPAHPTAGAQRAQYIGYAGDHDAIELVGPKGFVHGWIRESGESVRALTKALIRRRRAKLRSAKGMSPDQLRKFNIIGPHPNALAIKGLATELSARTAMLERTPAPRGRPGGPGLYDVEGMGHTPYLQQVVKALIEKRGMPSGKAYAIARAAIRKWMVRSKHPEVKGAATRAEAGEIERQARAKASHGHAISPWEITEALVELAVELGSPPGGPQSKNWQNEQRAAAGSPAGGQFSKGGGQQQQKKRKQQAARQEHRHDTRQRRALLTKIAGIRAQIAALQAQLPRHGKSRSSTPVKKGAAATSAKQAAAAKAGATKAGATARKTAKRPSPATINAKIAALRATLRADLAELRTL
ncbi:MAG TPA: hypothetical protein VEV45_21050 [Streptosporangiaceae bacterium]|nr:hypothetical protein [Streptosporangiaceae bacterium]